MGNWNEQTEQTVDIQEHEKQQNWYDLPEDRRKQLEVRIVNDRLLFNPALTS